MSEAEKKDLLDQSKKHIHRVTENILTHRGYIETSIQNLRETLRKGGLKDPEVLVSTLIHRLETKQQLEYSFKTPYFVRCDVKMDDEDEIKTFYFGRFPFTQDAIYSWVAPAATIRFEFPGRFSFTLPEGKERTGKLLRKDQFLIVDRRIVFMSTESTDSPRDLVYQEYFSEQKTGFVLPEIVEQMEKAQDKIIRSHYFGSFLISGAAGSGKTTLALHRVAYLLQSPETQSIFQPSGVIVFVQDTSTKQYFSGLLPQLGINHVKIVTFDEWAMQVLSLNEMQVIKRYGNTEEEKDAFEYSKKKALEYLEYKSNEKDISKMLEEAYQLFFSSEQKQLFKQQMKEKFLDRFDLTILMKYALKKDKKLIETVEKFVLQKSSRKYVKKQIKQEIQYSLIVIDEAENYLKEQIQILKTCINDKTQAIIYVGDLVQQTLPWTIKDWSHVNEQFARERQVILQKVYRNTKQILEYIKQVGFDPVIPPNIKTGKDVEEKTFIHKIDEMKYIKKLLHKDIDKTVGILAKSDDYLKEYRKEFLKNEKLHIMTINEAQGVEFDTVILVGMNTELFKTTNDNLELLKERQKVNRDLIYVALTRAMNNLYICGNTKLKSLLGN